MKNAAKMITVFCIMIAMLTGTFNAQAIYTIKKPPLSMQILDKKAVNPYAPILKGGKIFVPMRYTGGALGYEVTWSASTKTMQLKKNEQTIKITVGKAEAYLNGKKVKMDTAPILQNEKAYVSLAFLQKYFNYQSIYDPNKNVVFIKNKPVPVPTKAIYVLGEKLASTEKPAIKNGKVYIPLRVLSESLQFKFSWNAKLKTIDLKKSGQTFKLTIGNKDAYLNGKKIKLDAAPLLLDLRAYVPLTFIQKYFNYDMVYDKNKNNLSINKKKSGTPVATRGDETRGELVNIQDILYDDNGGFPQLNIIADKPMTYEGFAIGDPDRMVIDIPNAKVNTDFETKEIGKGGIIRVRIGQFSTEPLVARIVVDLENEKTCKLVQSDDKRSVSLIYANIIQPVQLSKEGNSDVLTIKGSSDLDTNVSRMDNPDRLVVDIKRAVLEQNDQASADSTPYTRGIRTGQFDVGTARVVVDLQPGTYYDVKTQGDTTKVYISNIPYSFVNYERYFNTAFIELSPGAEVAYMPSMSEDKKVLTLLIQKDLNVEQKRYDIADNVLEYIDIKKEVYDGATYTVATIKMKDMVSSELLSPTGSKLLKFKFTYKPDQINQIKIVIDAGHGGKDPGAISQSGIKEKDLNMDVAKRLDAILRNIGFQTIVTRTEDTYVDLASRANSGNQNYADFFMSIHFNAFNKSTQGIETLYYPNEITPENPISNREIANIFHNELLTALKRPSRGMTPRPNLYVLNKTKMPAILAELGFITNQEELSQIQTEAYREMAARALAVSIIKYYKNIQHIDFGIDTNVIYGIPVPQSVIPVTMPQEVPPLQPQMPEVPQGTTDLTTSTPVEQPTPTPAPLNP